MPWEDSSAGARAGKWAGSRACSEAHFRPTPPPPPRYHLPLSLLPSLSPNLPTPSALCLARLLSFPSRSIRVADGCLWTGQRWRLLFSREPSKVSQEPRSGAAEQLHRRRRSSSFRLLWLKEEGPGAGDLLQLPRFFALRGSAAPRRPGLPLPGGAGHRDTSNFPVFQKGVFC